MTQNESAENKKAARRWFDALAVSDYASMRDLMTEDVELWTSPSVRESAVAGREEVMGRLEAVFSSGRFYEPGSLGCKVLEIVADGDQTCAHVIMSARFPNGNPYENIYLVWQRWRDGRMSYQLELFDPTHWSNQRNA